MLQKDIDFAIKFLLELKEYKDTTQTGKILIDKLLEYLKEIRVKPER